ncbi:hypothetical protein COLO4_25985 [Corchorus olitorius]|uniref:F-box domain-containing protein n=1 Tax=Corchorus olitorius TaxID=93759 RepID=A0A1R3HZ48_9ROSI|nr:hypothetical protein COLO4_25985 [Corchorus olitorius]
MEYDGDQEYGISKLPDEIVISILRRIPMKEAARTSVLSRRWKSLWTLCPRLELDGSIKNFHYLTKVKGKDYCQSDRDIESGGFINWVNHVLESCHAHAHAHALDEFKVGFGLHDQFRPEIDKWVRFAFEKKVKRFELDFSWSFGGVITCDPYSYHLSLQALKIPSSTCISTISLTSLILKQVNVSDETLETLLLNSPFLECLCVGGSTSLIHLRVVGPSLCLKYLQVIQCPDLKSLQLDAPNLLSLKYIGPEITIPFINIPNLVELGIGGNYLPCFARNLPMLSPSNFSQLRKLALSTTSSSSITRDDIERSEHPILSQLKQLELNVIAFDDDDFLHYCPLIEACTSLNTLALQLTISNCKDTTTREVRRRNKCLHPSLRVVQVTGFVGQTADTELCIYLIENAIMLDKIIIDPCHLAYRGTPHEEDFIEMVKQGRECAEQLRSKYSLGDKLVIL